MRLESVLGDDPREILRGLRGALHGAGPALGLGMVGDVPAEVRAGTAVVVTTSGSTGVPKSVVLSRDALTASALATA
ncbi:MAG TPA: acyl-CoA synthetase, partial [Microbacterium sp.]|nr:acyl-CoA synthetase [Microbacterium sp.]